VSEQIKVGDLVLVVRPRLCCGHDFKLGLIFTALSVQKIGGLCTFCGKDGDEEVVSGGDFRILRNRLKRIPPLDEPEGEKRDENLKEPA
jgi:hypothetical protein